MERVMDALQRSENALLESPTGTGKTLCLLCSTLAWQREQARLFPQNSTNNNSTDNNSTRNHPNHSANSGIHDIHDNILSSSSQENNSNHNNDNSNNNNKHKLPTIIYASRTHSQLSQVVNELRNTRYRPKHALMGSREQLCIHSKVNPRSNTQSQNNNSHNNNNNSHNNNINILTSSEINHGCSQLTKERKCHYRNNLDSFVSNVTTDAELQPVMDMEELITMGKKRKVCPFYLTRGHVPQAEILFLPYNYLFDREARKNSMNEITWENSIVIFDEAHNLESFCSESASFDLTGIDVAGCIQEVTRAMGYMQSVPELVEHPKEEGTSLKMENLIRLKAIFLQFEEYLDEQLPIRGGSFVGEYIFEIFQRGANITYANHAIFLNFVRQLSNMIMDIRGTSSSSSSNMTTTGTPKIDHFASCLHKIFGTPTEGQSMARARAYRVHITSKGGHNHNHNQNHHPSRNSSSSSSSSAKGRTLSYWCFAPSLAMNELSSLRVRSILVTSGTLSPLPSYSLELGLPFPHTLENPHIIHDDQIHVRVVGKGVTGKTLCCTYEKRDNETYIHELGSTILGLARVIPAGGGILLFFPSYGVMDTCIERWGGPLLSARSSWNAQKKNTPNSFFRPRRGGAGAGGRRSSGTPIGPRKNSYSFPYAPDFYASSSGGAGGGGRLPTIWERLRSIKSIVLEPKSSIELKDAIHEFDKYIAMPKSPGCILMGVCRGKISEGIDFADDKCRAVLITGIPFAPYLDPKVKLKREYLDKQKSRSMIRPTGEGGFDDNSKDAEGQDLPRSTSTSNTNPSSKKKTCLSGAEWYMQQAHRAVNQAIGRVIRHRSDYGVILFLDVRYNEQRNHAGLSKWVRPHLQKDVGFGASIGALVKFFKTARKKAELDLIERNHGENVNGGRGIRLAYEQENKPEMGDQIGDDMTKIALVRTSSIIGGGKGGSDDSNNAEEKTSIQNTHEEAFKSKHDEDDEVLRGYIPPDRVVRRIELEQESTKKGTEYEDRFDTIMKQHSNVKNTYAKSNSSTSNTLSRTGLAALYQSTHNKPVSSSSSSSSMTSNYSRIASSHWSNRKIQYSNTKAPISETIASAWASLKDSSLNTSQKHNITKHITRQENVSNSTKPLSQISSTTFPENNNLSPAQQFFNIGKTYLSATEFDNVRKHLISMKAHGDKNDSESYIKTAQSLIRILIQFDKRCPGNDPNDCQISTEDNTYQTQLLDLLYSLLPTVHRFKIESYACQQRYELSSFRCYCRATLPSQDYSYINDHFPSFMVDRLRHPNTMDISKKGYLKDIEPLIRMLMKTPNKSQNDNTNGDIVTTTSFLWTTMNELIPASFRNEVMALVNELNSAQEVQQRKVMDTLRVGEKSIKTVLFQKPQMDGLMKVSKEIGAFDDSNELSTEEMAVKGESLLRAQHAKIEKQKAIINNIGITSEIKKKRVNPYARPVRKQQPKLENNASNTPKGMKTQTSKRARVMAEIVLSNSSVSSTPLSHKKSTELKKERSDKSPCLDPLDQCLKEARAEAFVQETPRNVKMNRRLKSNVPDGMTCVICDESPNKVRLAAPVYVVFKLTFLNHQLTYDIVIFSIKPFMGSCRHVACLDCWMKWLGRSKTCPTCRMPTTKDSLERVVFISDSEKTPTLTQMCRNESDEDSEGDLEIIGK